MACMNLKQLETFVRVAEIGSFSRAAVLLRTAQPALSRQVRQLEVELRANLLTRTGRGVALTEAGRRLYEHGLGILAQLQKAREDLADNRETPSGRVVIGLPPSLGREITLPLVQTFERVWPQGRLAMVEGLSAHILEWLASGRVDLGLLYNPDASSGFEIQPLRRERLCLISPAGSAQSEKDVSLAALASLPLVMPERMHAIRRLLETESARAGVKLQIAWEMSSVPAILDLVRAGHGHAVLTLPALKAPGQADGLVATPIEAPAMHNSLCLARSAAKKPTVLQTAVAQWLAGKLGPP
jgi:LysR family nitrogen assimilation transcriptional regulator